MSRPGATPIDPEAWRELLALGGEDAGEMVQELITMYLEDGEVLLEAIRQNQAAGDAEALGRSSHALRSPSATLGALRLAELCREVEVACHAEPPARPSIQPLINEAERVFSALRQRLVTP